MAPRVSLHDNATMTTRRASCRRRLILRQTRLLELSRRTRGTPRVRIALIDGPVAIAHPVLAAAMIEQHPQTPGAELAAEYHATFIASLLVGSGGGVLGLAPGCTLISLPFQDARFQRFELPAREAAERVARAIYRGLELGADVIQLSLDFLPASDGAFGSVVEALKYSASRGVCAIIAAGNHPRLGASKVLAAPGVLSVAAADEMGSVLPQSPLGPAIGRGLRCPGANLPGAAPPDRVLEASGSSFAAAVASGAIALLKSLRPELSDLANSRRPPEVHGAIPGPALNRRGRLVEKFNALK